MNEIEKLIQSFQPSWDKGWGFIDLIEVKKLRRKLRVIIRDAFQDGQVDIDFDTQEEAKKAFKEKWGFRRP